MKLSNGTLYLTEVSISSVGRSLTSTEVALDLEVADLKNGSAMQVVPGDTGHPLPYDGSTTPRSTRSEC